jgi:hypothetical protein
MTVVADADLSFAPLARLPQDFFANRLGVGESTVPRPIGDNEGRALASRTAAQAPAVSP